MGLGIQITGKPQRRRLFARRTSGQVLRDIERYFRSQDTSTCERLIKTSRDEQELLVFLHPAEEPVNFSFDDRQTVICSARTSSTGPGYHHYLVNLLEECGESVGIDWTWDSSSGDVGDETGYYQHRDYEKLQAEMLRWLQALSRNVASKESRFSLCLPVGYTIVGSDHFAMSPLGFWEREWFERVARSSLDELTQYGEQLFPWWRKGQDALFWLNTALTLLWVHCPWHQPTSKVEVELYQLTVECLERAYTLDSSLTFPWAEWKEILEFLDDRVQLKQVESRAPAATTKPAIGFKRRAMRQPLTGEWSIVLPGYFYSDLEDNGRTAVYWFEDRTVRGSSLEVESRDGKVPPPVSEFLPRPPEGDFDEIVDLQSDRIVGWAGIRLAEENGNTYWMLQGHAAFEARLATVTICFDNLEDREWAIATWRSIAP